MGKVFAWLIFFGGVGIIAPEILPTLLALCSFIVAILCLMWYLKPPGGPDAHA